MSAENAIILGLLLWAWHMGDIDRLLHRPVGRWSAAAANSGSGQCHIVS